MRAFAIATAALLTFSGSVSAQVTALTNATLIDGTGAAPQSGATHRDAERPHHRHRSPG